MGRVGISGGVCAVVCHENDVCRVKSVMRVTVSTLISGNASVPGAACVVVVGADRK